MGRKFGWVVAALVLAWCVADVIARASCARALSAPWAGGLGSLNDVPLRHEPHPRSSAATHRADLVRTVGIDLTIGDDASPGAKAREARARFVKVQPLIGSYVRRQLGRGDDVIEMPPPDVAAFLLVNEAPLSAIRADLRANPGDWAVDKPWDGADVNFSGHLDLTRLLAASALARAWRSDVAGAWEDLHCIWELGCQHHRCANSQPHENGG
jgi:hypothetical protein